jgi:hypothetical protein
VAPFSATDADIAALIARSGMHLAPELVDWLRLCNGLLLAGGELLGVPPAQVTTIERMLELMPEWRERGWLPVGGDRCGDYCVLDAHTGPDGLRPVYFVDQADMLAPDYVVASGLWPFVRGFFHDTCVADDPGDITWPFDREHVLAEDPDLARYAGGVRFAWDE